MFTTTVTTKTSNGIRNATFHPRVYDVLLTSRHETDIITWIDMILPPVIFFFGLFSNALVILVMRSRYFHSTPISIYISSISIIDSMGVLLMLPIHFLHVNFPSFSQRLQGQNWLCRLINSFGWGTSDLGIYFTVTMTIDRAFAIWKPLKRRFCCTKSKIIITMVALTSFEVVKLLPLLIYSRVVQLTPTSNSKYEHSALLCVVRHSNGDLVSFYENVWTWIHVAILMMCYISAMACNCFIIVNVKKSIKLHKNTSLSNQISLILVIDSITLIIFTLPFALVTVLASRSNLFEDNQEEKRFLMTICFYLLYINRCLNLFLYCISGSQFRNAMKLTLARYCHCFLEAKSIFQSNSGYGTEENQYLQRASRVLLTARIPLYLLWPCRMHQKRNVTSSISDKTNSIVHGNNTETESHENRTKIMAHKHDVNVFMTHGNGTKTMAHENNINIVVNVISAKSGSHENNASIMKNRSSINTIAHEDSTRILMHENSHHPAQLLVPNDTNKKFVADASTYI